MCTNNILSFKQMKGFHPKLFSQTIFILYMKLVCKMKKFSCRLVYPCITIIDYKFGVRALRGYFGPL